MKHLKRSIALLSLIMVTVVSWTFAQQCFHSGPIVTSARGREVRQNNEYTRTGQEKGIFYCNPLMLNGRPLDYDIFNLSSKGELTVIKGTSVPGFNVRVPFYAYLRRDGNIVFLPMLTKSNNDRTQIELSDILRFARPGDQLIIQPIKKEDGPAKRILKVVGGGC